MGKKNLQVLLDVSGDCGVLYHYPWPPLASLTCPALGELGGPAHPLECRPPHYSTLAATHPPVLNFFLPGFSQYMDQFLGAGILAVFFVT